MARSPGQPGDVPARLPKPAPGEDARSPFEIDVPAACWSDPAAGAEPSPFEQPGPRGLRGPRGSNAPVLAAPAHAPDFPSPAAEIDPADAGSPLLAAVDASARLDARGSGAAGRERRGRGAAVVATPAEEVEHTHQHQAAPRRSRLGTLMSSLGWNVRR